MNTIPSFSSFRFVSRLLLATGFLAVSVCANAQVLVNENFDGYTTGDLTPQGGWSTLAGRATGLVLAGPGGGNTSNTVGRNTSGTAALNKDALFSAGSLASSGSNSQVLLTFDIYVDAANAISLYGIGASSYTSNQNPSAQFGIWNGSLAIRGENFGSIFNPVNGSGTALTLTTGNWYSVQSLWDLSANGGQGSATLAIKNLTAGDSGYTTLYFDAAQTVATVNLGLTTNVSLWTTAYLRVGQSTGNGQAYLDNLNATVVPEPAAAALAGLGMMILIFRRRKVAQ